MHKDDETLDLAARTLTARTSRRSFLQRAAALAVTAPAIGGLLAACGGDDDDDDDDEASATATPAEEATATQASGGGDEPTEAPEDSDSGDEDEPTAAEQGGGALPDASVVVALGLEIVNLDTHNSGGNQDNIISKNIYSRLVFTDRISENEEILVPDLATEWEISDDGLEITFHLREGVKWQHDYGDFTASDVVFTLNRVRDEEIASRWRADYANVIDVIEEDPYTVRIVLENPDPLLLHTSFSRTGFILNEQALADGGEDYSSRPVGTGPYTFTNWTKGEQCEVVRNDGHWLLKEDSNVQRAVFRFLENELSTQLGFEAGELDMGLIQQPEVQIALVENPDISTLVQTHTRLHNIEPGAVPPDHICNDVNFRRALSLAIDRQVLADEVMLGMGRPAHSVLNPNHYGFLDEELYPFIYDPDEARSLLAQTDYDGSTLEFLTSNESVYVNLSVIVQAFWKEIGVDVELIPLEVAISNERRNSGSFELMNLGGARDYPEQIIYPQFTSDGIPVNNQWGYTGIDDLAEELRYEPDFEVRTELIQQIQRQIAEDVPMIPLAFPQLIWAHRPDIEIAILPTVADTPLWHVRVNG